MSNIIKKITKKYKWLRFLNYKTTKLAVLSAALFGLCLSSGASFAKYRDENYGGGNAGIATMGDVVVSYIEGNAVPTIQLPKKGTTADSGLHAFLATIKVQFFNVEVKQEFSIKFKLGHLNNSSYNDSSKPINTFFALTNDVTLNNLTTYAKADESSDSSKMTIANAKNSVYTGWNKFNVSSIMKNTVYYSFEKTTDPSAISSNYGYSTWNTYTYSGDSIDRTLFITKGESVDPIYDTTIFFYKILFFVNFEFDNDSIIAESSKIFYELNSEQVA